MPAILIADDDPTIRTMFAHALQSRGQVDQAANGAEALRKLGKLKYDIVLLDLHMPLVDGFMVLQTLAIKPGLNGETPVYVITADTAEHTRIRAMLRQAVFFMTKPVAISTLVTLVDDALKRAALKAKGGP